MYPRRENACVKPSATVAGTCSMGNCLGGFRCDCASSTVCEKSNITSWSKAGDPVNERFKCDEVVATVPTRIVGFTADFTLNADDSFTLYVDGVAIGAGTGGPGETHRLTAPIYTSSAVVIEVLKSSPSSTAGAAVKFRYVVDGTEHTIDDTWVASSARVAGFQLNDFNDSGWATPGDVASRGHGFDAAVNWKGLETSSSELFLRRRVPSAGATA